MVEHQYPAFDMLLFDIPPPPVRVFYIVASIVSNKLDNRMARQTQITSSSTTSKVQKARSMTATHLLVSDVTVIKYVEYRKALF